MLMFVEPYSNPLEDAKRPQHRETVKRWSMLNRHVSLARPHGTWTSPDDKSSTSPSTSPTSSSDPPHVANPAPQAAPIKGRLIPLRTSKSNTTTDPSTSTKSNALTPRRRRAWLQAWNRACGLAPAPCIETLGSTPDPFASLPIKLDASTAALVDLYLRRWRPPEHGGFRADGQHPARLHDARRFIWLPLALESEGAGAALVAFAAAAGAGVDGHAAEQLERRLGRALALTNRDLRDPGVAGSNGVMLAVALLMLAARCMGDAGAFEAHCGGVEVLLRHRALDSIAAADMATSDAEADALFGQRKKVPFTGQGFADVYEQGFISVHSWQGRWATALRVSPLILATGTDMLWYTALQQHVWLIDDDSSRLNEGRDVDAVDRMLAASLRLAWHMTVFRGFPTKSPVIIATSRAIRSAVNEIDLGVVGAAADWALLWTAMVGSSAGRQQRWFGQLLKLALRRLGDMNYDEAVAEAERRFFWHEALEDLGGRRWWDASVRGALPAQETLLAQLREKEAAEGCCGGGGGGGGRCGGSDADAGMTEMDKMCLCAWWT